jgi:glycosyltransferase involved in cell wall biosynthesis
VIPEAWLCIVGPNEGILAELQARAAAAGVEKQVVFPGLIVGEEKEKLLAAASLFAFFSRDEPFGLAAIEAAAHGLPLLVSRHIGIASLVEEKGAGEMVDPLETAHAAAVMQKMLHPLAAAGYRANLPRLLEPFRLEQVARAAVDLYGKL